MKFVKIEKEVKVNQELMSDKVRFTSTLKIFKELDYDYVKDLRESESLAGLLK